VDNKFVADTIAQGNAAPTGIKSRFNHPNQCFGALGTMLGDFKNFRAANDGTAAIADLHMSKAAEVSPSGNLAEYIYTLAETSPSKFGASISFSHTGEYYTYDEEGNERPWDPSEEDEPEKIYLTLAHLDAADLVDDPAATDGLFSSEANSNQFAVQVTDFLDTNPAIWEWAEKHPDVIEKFITQYRNYTARKGETPTLSPPTRKMKAKFSFLQWAKSWFTAHSAQFDIDVTDEAGQNLRIVTTGDMIEVGQEIVLIPAEGEPQPAPDGNYTVQSGEHAGKILAVADGTIADITDPEQPEETPAAQDPAPPFAAETSTESAAFTALQAQFTALQAEIIALKKRPAAAHTDIDAEDFSHGDDEEAESDYNKTSRIAFERAQRAAKKRK
jgi:hypothetical protein